MSFMPSRLSNLQHIVVVMLENRSFDNVAGFLYDQSSQARHFLPAGTDPHYNGMPVGYSNPSNPAYFEGTGPANPQPVHRGADNLQVPIPTRRSCSTT